MRESPGRGGGRTGWGLLLRVYCRGRREQVNGSMSCIPQLQLFERLHGVSQEVNLLHESVSTALRLRPGHRPNPGADGGLPPRAADGPFAGQRRSSELSRRASCGARCPPSLRPGLRFARYPAAISSRILTPCRCGRPAMGTPAGAEWPGDSESPTDTQLSKPWLPGLPRRAIPKAAYRPGRVGGMSAGRHIGNPLVSSGDCR